MKKAILKILAICVLTACLCVICAACNPKTEDDIEYQINENGEVEIVSFSETSDRTEIRIPDEIEGHPVVSINNFSLFNNETLQTIYIGKNVRQIGDWAMTNDRSLKAFVVDEANEYFCSDDGVLFSKDKKTLIAYPNARNIELDRFGQTTDTTTYTVPDGVEIIANRAFYRCVYLTEVTMPASVTTIGEMAFHCCKGLKDIHFGDGIRDIQRDAFSYCTELTEIEIPASIEHIGEYVFSCSEKIKTVVIHRAESQVSVDGKWYPTRDGQNMKDLNIVWA